MKSTKYGYSVEYKFYHKLVLGTVGDTRAVVVMVILML